MKRSSIIKAFFKKLTREKNKDTGILIAIIIIIWEYWSNNTQLCFYSVPILLITILIPFLFSPIAFVIFALSSISGKIIQQIIFSVIFFLMIVPISFFRKAMKKDILKRHAFKKFNNSAFINREYEYSSKDFEKPF